MPTINDENSNVHLAPGKSIIGTGFIKSSVRFEMISGIIVIPFKIDTTARNCVVANFIWKLFSGLQIIQDDGDE